MLQRDKALKLGEALESKLAAAEAQIEKVFFVYVYVSFVHILGLFGSCIGLFCLYIHLFYT